MRVISTRLSIREFQYRMAAGTGAVGCAGVSPAAPRMWAAPSGHGAAVPQPGLASPTRSASTLALYGDSSRARGAAVPQSGRSPSAGSAVTISQSSSLVWGQQSGARRCRAPIRAQPVGWHYRQAQPALLP